MNKAVELKPCPFCESIPQRITKGNTKGRVRCNGHTPDGVQCRISKLTWTVDCWQTRAPMESIIAKIEAEKAKYDDSEVDYRAALDKAISIIREFQTNQTKGN